MIDICDAQLLIIHETFRQVVLGEVSLIIPAWVCSLQSLVYLGYVHLLGLVGSEKLSDIVHYGAHQVLSRLIRSTLLASAYTISIVTMDVLQCSEAEVHELDCLVNVLLDHYVSEVELCHSLANSDDGKQRSWCDVGVAHFLFAFFLELSFLNVSSYDVVVQVCRNRWIESLSIGNV